MTAERRPGETTGDDAFIDDLCGRIGGGRAVRLKLPHGGRVHIDRPLPFLALHRERPEAISAALGATVASPLYVVWPEGEAADAFGRRLIARVGAALRTRLGAFLAVELYDLPPPPAPRKADAPTPIPYHYEIAASEHDTARAAAHVLAEALGRIRMQRRKPKIIERREPPGADGPTDGLPRVSLGLPPAYRIPEIEGVYPGLLHRLETRVLDALLQAACAVVERSDLPAPAHHRALGRSSFIQAARTVDRKLAGIASSFDFLMSVSPINTAQAWREFRAGKFAQEPKLHYRPLSIDPSERKRALWRVGMRSVEDPVLETLFTEKQQEIDLQLTLLQTRGTRSFKAASTMLYGPVEDRLHDQATALITALAGRRTDLDEADDADAVDCHGIEARALALIDGYRSRYAAFRAQVEIRDDVTGLMVSGPRMMIGRDARVRPFRVDGLLAHEVSVHLLTHYTGKAQGLQIFRSGLAGYEGVQEGLGVFAEYAVGALSRDRLRLLAARVLATRAMLDGGGFMDTFRLLTDEHGMSARSAFHIAARVYRSGGLAKDAIYLQGLLTVLDHVGKGAALDPFWSGKIAVEHLPVVAELNDRGFLQRPPVTPEFLDRPAAQPRLERARQGLSLADLI